MKTTSRFFRRAAQLLALTLIIGGDVAVTWHHGHAATYGKLTGTGSGSGSSSSTQWTETQLARAAAAMGTTSIGADCTDFTRSYEYSLLGANAPTLLTTVNGGVIQCAGPGACAARFAGTYTHVKNPRTSSWYYTYRVQFPDAPDANTTHIFGETDGVNNSVSLVLSGATSITTLFLQFYASGVQGTNTALSSLIGTDIAIGSFYDLAVSSDGTTVNAWLNGVSVASRTDISNIPTTGGFISIDSTPGAGGKRVWVDAMCVIFKRAP